MGGCKPGKDSVTLNQVIDVIFRQEPLPTWKWQKKPRGLGLGMRHARLTAATPASCPSSPHNGGN